MLTSRALRKPPRKEPKLAALFIRFTCFLWFLMIPIPPSPRIRDCLQSIRGHSKRNKPLYVDIANAMQLYFVVPTGYGSYRRVPSPLSLLPFGGAVFLSSSAERIVHARPSKYRSDTESPRVNRSHVSKQIEEPRLFARAVDARTSRIKEKSSMGRLLMYCKALKAAGCGSPGASSTECCRAI